MLWVQRGAASFHYIDHPNHHDHVRTSLWAGAFAYTFGEYMREIVFAFVCHFIYLHHESI